MDLLINEKRIKNVQLLKAECDTRGITGNMTEDKLKELLKVGLIIIRIHHS